MTVNIDYWPPIWGITPPNPHLTWISGLRVRGNLSPSIPCSKTGIRCLRYTHSLLSHSHNSPLGVLIVMMVRWWCWRVISHVSWWCVDIRWSIGVCRWWVRVMVRCDVEVLLISRFWIWTNNPIIDSNIQAIKDDLFLGLSRLFGNLWKTPKMGCFWPKKGLFGSILVQNETFWPQNDPKWT